jgi:aerobic carbon-monoxide dehydrogenase small subunit
MLMTVPSLVDVTATVNGTRRAMTVATNAVLVDTLRDTLGLKGCKLACDAAVCGACTVLVDGAPVTACSTFAFEIDGKEVTTIEGLGDPATPHPLQQAFLENDAFQCGFCTPGMILSVKALLAENPDPDDAAIRAWLGGNLCRCTGYQMIIETVRTAAAAMRAQTVAAEKIP